MCCPHWLKRFWEKMIYFFIGSFYGAISVILSILTCYVDWLRRGPASLYPGGDEMHTGRYIIKESVFENRTQRLTVIQSMT